MLANPTTWALVAKLILLARPLTQGVSADRADRQGGLPDWNVPPVGMQRLAAPAEADVPERPSFSSIWPLPLSLIHI